MPTMPWEIDVHMVAIGKTGSGKSSALNTILNKQEFNEACSFTSQTRTCQYAIGRLPGDRSLMVVDTPGFFDTHLSKEQINVEIAKCVTLCVPGPHAFLVVIPFRRYTEEDNKAVTEMEKVFGELALRRHGIVLFTHGDVTENTGETIEHHLQTAPQGLLDLLNKCGNRYHVFNNGNRNNREQVRDLLEKVNNMMRGNRGQRYTNELLEAAKRRILSQITHPNPTFIEWIKANLSGIVQLEVQGWVKAILAGAAIGAVIAGAGFVVGAAVVGEAVLGAGAVGAAAAAGAAVGGTCGLMHGPHVHSA